MAKGKKRGAMQTRKSAQRAAAGTRGGGVGGAATTGLARLARQIVETAKLPRMGIAELRALYNEDCTSEEAIGRAAVGYAGLEEKRNRWEQMRKSERLRARNVWIGRHTICIEWDWEVELLDGRTVNLREIAVHEIRNGKIQNERYYYNPSVFWSVVAQGRPNTNSVSSTRPTLDG